MDNWISFLSVVLLFLHQTSAIPAIGDRHLPSTRRGRSSPTTEAEPLPLTTDDIPPELMAQIDEDEIVETIIIQDPGTELKFPGEETSAAAGLPLDAMDQVEESLHVVEEPSNDLSHEEKHIVNKLTNEVLKEAVASDFNRSEVHIEELPRNAQKLTQEQIFQILSATAGGQLDSTLPANRKQPGESPIYRLTPEQAQRLSQYTPRDVDGNNPLSKFGAEMQDFLNRDENQAYNNNFPQLAGVNALGRQSVVTTPAPVVVSTTVATPPAGSDPNANLPGVSTGEGDDEVRCIPKVMQIEETVYDRAMKCHHSYQEKCHMTYITDYESATAKKCDTTYKKNCHITLNAMPFEETVNVCHTPFVRRCGNETVGPDICTTQYEDSCETRYKTYDIEQDEPVCKMENVVRCQNVTIEIPIIRQASGGGTEPVRGPIAIQEKCEEWPVRKCTLEKKIVQKVHPETACKKIPREVCVPNNCAMVKGEEICRDEIKVQVQNVPEEECELQPMENCRMEATLVPRLVPKPNCLKVPKEICVNTKKNPRRVKKPVIKEWCYKPSDLRENPQTAFRIGAKELF